MKLEEVARSYIDDPRYVELLKFVTWKGEDVAASWIGKYEPATHSDDGDLNELAKFNRDHYWFYLFFVEHYMDKIGKIIDVGCGSGQRTVMLGRYSNVTIGLDSDPVKIAFAKTFNYSGKVQYYTGQFPFIAISDLADYIFAVEVLEHILPCGQAEFVERALGFLEPGGLLFITTPADKIVDRRKPHIGLWEFADFEKFRADPRTVASGYLRAGEKKQESDKDIGTAYYLVMKNGG